MPQVQLSSFIHLQTMDPNAADIPMVELKTKTETQTVTKEETQIEVHSEPPPTKSTDEKSQNDKSEKVR